MNYSQQEKTIIFQEWIQGILSSLKKFIIQEGEQHSVTILFPDAGGDDYEALIEITVRKKQIEQEEEK